MVQLRIERVGSTASPIKLEMAYRLRDGKNVYYSPQGQMISEEDYKKGAQVYTIGFEKGEISRIVQFDLETGKNELPKTEAYKAWVGQVTLKDALFQHTFVDHPKNQNIGSKVLFRLVDVNEEKINGVQEIKRAMALMNKISDMDIIKMRDTCYYLNVPTTGKTAEDIYVELLKPGFGYAYKFYDKIMNMATDPRTEVTVNVNKAIHMNIVEIKNGGYFHRGEQVANTLDGLYVYFLENGPLFTGLKKQVVENDTLPISVGNELDANKGRVQLADDFASKQTLKTEISEAEHAANKVIAEELNILGRHNAKPETLARMITDKQKQIAEREAAKRLSKEIS